MSFVVILPPVGHPDRPHAEQYNAALAAISNAKTAAQRKVAHAHHDAVHAEWMAARAARASAKKKK
jgi:hypothetical protein